MGKGTRSDGMGWGEMTDRTGNGELKRGKRYTQTANGNPAHANEKRKRQTENANGTRPTLVNPTKWPIPQTTDA